MNLQISESLTIAFLRSVWKEDSFAILFPIDDMDPTPPMDRTLQEELGLKG
jgi:hypothetical protein